MDRHNGKLTERQMEVVEMVVEGLSNEEIAEKLVLSVCTVKNHVSNIADKLGIERRRMAGRRNVRMEILRWRYEENRAIGCGRIPSAQTEVEDD